MFCPHCRNPFPLFVKPSRWIWRGWKNSLDGKCPSCDETFQTKISFRLALIVFPVVLLLMIAVTELIENIPFLNQYPRLIIGASLAGLVAGFGLRFSVVSKNDKVK